MLPPLVRMGKSRSISWLWFYGAHLHGPSSVFTMALEDFQDRFGELFRMGCRTRLFWESIHPKTQNAPDPRVIF